MKKVSCEPVSVPAALLSMRRFQEKYPISKFKIYRWAAMKPRPDFIIKCGRQLLFDEEAFIEWLRETDGLPQPENWQPKERKSRGEVEGSQS